MPAKANPAPTPGPGAGAAIVAPPANTPPVVPDYQLLRRIGQGSFGEVWLARNALDSFCAVKVVHRAAFADASDYERELTGVRRFEPISRSHDGLVDLLHVGVNAAAGYFYYVMELADDAAAPGGNPKPEIRNPKPDDAPRQLAIGDWQSYAPLTLSACLRAAGRLPYAECLRVGVALTDALEFLHRRGLIHRDIKPSNIIFVGGVPKLADVGTVTHVDVAKTMVGTQGFQAPEGPGKPQADLYSLGKVLYEISTGKDRQRFPEPLTTLANLTDRAQWQEFSSVVDKACQPEPTRRYPSTTELRADLLTLQAGRSVRRQWLLEKRFHQALWALAVVVVLVLSVLSIQFVQLRATQRGLALLKLEQAIRPPHTAGWSATAWQMASNAAAKFGFDTNLQSQAAACLSGLDAKCLFQTNGLGGSSVAFSADGQRILYGALDDGTTNSGQAHLLDLDTTNLSAYPVPGKGPVAFLPDGTPVQFSADTSNRLALWRVGPGPAGRRADVSSAFGTTAPDNGAPSGQNVRAPQPTALRYFTLRTGATIGYLTSLTLTPDAGFVAASGTNTAGQPFLAAWNGTSGELLPVAASRQSAANLSPEKQRRSTEPPLRGPPATALAFTPDGSYLAAGNDSGEVTVWRVSAEPSPDAGKATGRVTGRATLPRSLNLPPQAPAPQERRPTTDAAPLAKISAGRLPILSLAFCRDYVRDPLHPAPEPQWLLAIGDKGAGVSIWEVPNQRLRTRCQGGQYDRNALAFSPDGTLLVAGGRTPTLVWDTATGHSVAALLTCDYMTGLAISGDGSKVATTSQRSATLWASALENGRGIQTLRGLSTPVPRMCFSPDARWLAAVAQDWQVGIWDVANGQLLWVFNLPRGTFTADNAAMAFSHDNAKFAYMAGTHALLIDLASGTCAPPWTLPPGRVEELVFDPAGRLYAAHFESADVTAKTLSWPRTFRIRELLPGGRTTNLFELPEFNQDVRAATWAPDASFILVAGVNVKEGRTNRFLRALSLTGRTNLWTLPQQFEPGATAYFSLDAAGSLIAFAPGPPKVEGWDYYLIDAATGNTNRRLALLPTALNSSARQMAQMTPAGAWRLYALADDSLLAVIQSGATKPAHPIPAFSRDGRFLAWGNDNGTVSVCDLETVRQSLSKINLGWR